MLKPRLAQFASCLALALGWPLAPLLGATHHIQEAEMSGYLLVPNEKVPKTYNAGKQRKNRFREKQLRETNRTR